ncbi:MAG: NusG domain II-containing protein [Nitrospirales bacterium]|nr:NusG domain II-containing protein [Nitrospirales bacterium]
MKRSRRATFADRMLLLFLLFLSLYSFFFIRQALPQGAELEIEVSGELRYALPLSTNKTVEVEGPLGRTVIEVKEGRARIKDSPCRNRICMHQGWIRSGAVVCLPNRVMIRVTGTAGRREMDAISG